MFDLLERVSENAKPLGRVTNPGAAAVIGFLFGGIGLALYFRTAADTVLLIVVALIVGVELSTASWFIGAAVVSVYGYLRSTKSNAQLLQLAQSSPA